MIQIYPLFADFYVHLHCYMLKSINVTLAYIFQIMVAHNQIYLSVQPVKDFTPFGRTAKTEIAQMKDGVILTDCIIPIGDYGLIHHFRILKGPVAETNDILVIEMGIGCKEHLTAIKFVVHFLFNFQN